MSDYSSSESESESITTEIETSPDMEIIDGNVILKSEESELNINEFISNKDLLMNKNDMPLQSYEKIKMSILKTPTLLEIQGIILKQELLINNGAPVLIDENKFYNTYGIHLYNNYNIINPYTITFISAILDIIPIYVRKNNKLFKRYGTDICYNNYYIYYYTHIKHLLRYVYTNDAIVNSNILKRMFPLYIKRLFKDDIIEEEVMEIKNTKAIIVPKLNGPNVDE